MLLSTTLMQGGRPCCPSLREVVFTQEADVSGDLAVQAAGVSIIDDNHIRVLAQFDPRDRKQHDEASFGYYVSEDEGESFHFEGPIGPTKPLAIVDWPPNPAKTSVRYRVGHEQRSGQDESRLERSIDGGVSWVRMKGMINSSGQPMQEFVEPRYDRRNPDWIFVSAGLPIPWTKLVGVFVSRDGGDSFQVLYSRRGVFPPTYDVSPVNPNVIYVEDGKGSIYGTFDGGYAWNLVGQNDEIRAPPVPEKLKGTEREKEILTKRWNECRQIILDRNSANTAYLVTDKGILRTSDGGNHWCVLNLRFNKPASITTLALSGKVAGTMFAGTTMGLYRSKDLGCTWDFIDVVKRTAGK